MGGTIIGSSGGPGGIALRTLTSNDTRTPEWNAECEVIIHKL